MRALPGHKARRPSGLAPRSREEAAGDQRLRILEAGAELFAKRGYRGTTIELITRRAKVGYATFYKHFADKEECFLALFDYATDVAGDRVRTAYCQQDAPWPRKVAVGLRALFEVMAEHPASAKVCLVEALAAGPRAVARYDEAMKRVRPMLEPGRELNPRRDQLPRSLEDTLAGGVLWIAYQRLVVGEADRLAERLPETIELVLTPYVGEDEAVRVAGEFAGRPVGPG